MNAIAYDEIIYRTTTFSMDSFLHLDYRAALSDRSVILNLSKYGQIKPT